MKAIKLIKSAFKWYFEQAAKSYAWTPTGMMIHQD